MRCRRPPVAASTRLWWGPRPGASLTGLAGQTPFSISVDQPRYWVYFDPTWDWRTLDYSNYEEFFDLTIKRVGPIMATDNPELSRFKARGGKLILWHGWADQLIMPDGTIDYYDAVTEKMGGGYAQTQTFARLFMAPGVAHCGGGDGPQPQGLLEAVVNWVEHGEVPSTITASRTLPTGALRTRPLCPYPQTAVWNGSGSTDDARSFVCQQSR
jgi:tannase/feruloyl esterase